jgi:hypothetical protein
MRQGGMHVARWSTATGYQSPKLAQGILHEMLVWGARAEHAEGKASLNEGHGFSRAVNCYSLDGFSR